MYTAFDQVGVQSFNVRIPQDLTKLSPIIIHSKLSQGASW